MNTQMKMLDERILLEINGGISENACIGIFVAGTLGGIVVSAINPMAGCTIILGSWGIACDQAGY